MEEQRERSIWFRLYEWPICFLVGGAVGVLTSTICHKTDPLVEGYLQPVGVWLSWLGWVVIITNSFVAISPKVLKIDQPAKAQKIAQYILSVLGIGFCVVAWTFFGLQN